MEDVTFFMVSTVNLNRTRTGVSRPDNSRPAPSRRCAAEGWITTRREAGWRFAADDDEDDIGGIASTQGWPLAKHSRALRFLP
jgi:hypothetical protein